QPIVLQTAGKSTTDLERELVKALGSQGKFSMLPIFPNFVELKSRNYKPFDGGEAQLSSFEIKSITVDMDDVGLGVLTKFNFSSIEASAGESNQMTYLIALLIAGVAGYFVYTSKKNKEEA
ncbi:MAG: hypothetical protein KAG19_01290, partial [Methylococcales bacterium]|nr:hypothetical protein [Methylococcales bacterium]